MQAIKIAHDKMSTVLNKLFRTKLTITIRKAETAMNGKVADYYVRLGFMGSIISNDLTPVLAKSYLLVKRALELKQKFKFYTTINYGVIVIMDSNLMYTQVSFQAIKPLFG